MNDFSNLVFTNRCTLRLLFAGLLAVILAGVMFVFLPNTVRADNPIPLPTNPDWISDFVNRIDFGVWGDVDGDGDLDLAAVGLNQLVVFVNNGLDEQGKLSFTSTESFGGGTQFTSVALGDIDGDSDLDLAVGKREEGENSRSIIYLNVTTNTVKFTPAKEDELKRASEALAWGDSDGDGDLDLAVGNSLHLTALPDYLYENSTDEQGRQKFTPVWSNTNVYSQATNSMAWGDVDRDGDLDLAVAGDFKLHLFENKAGQLATTPAVTIARTGLNDKFSHAVWGDMDGDGFLELAVKRGEFVPSQIYSLKKTGEVWTAEVVWVQPDKPFTPGFLDWGDVDNDGDLDLAMDFENTTVRVYRNLGKTLQTTAADWASGNALNTNDVRWVDVNGDGNLDLTSVGGGLAVVFLNRGAALPATPQVTASPSISSTIFGLAWGDIDGDGQLELAAGAARNPLRFHHGSDVWGTWWAASNFIYRLKAGKLEPDPLAWSPANVRATTSVAWGDVDGDGDLDLAVGNSPETGAKRSVNNGWNELYRNDDGILSTTPVFTFGAGTEKTLSVAWGDVDGDGDLDLAAGNYNAPNRVYLNKGGILSNTWKLASGPTTSVAWGDVDNDGDLDLAVAERQPQLVVRIYQNNGRLTDSQSYTLPVGDAVSLAWGDMNRDGWLDLAVGIRGAPNKVFINDKGLLLPTPGWQSDDSDFKSVVAWGDVNGDGWLDLAVTNGTDFGGGAKSKVYINQSGRLSPGAAWQSAVVNISTSLAWGDANSDGLLDLAFGTSTDAAAGGKSASTLYLNQGQKNPLTGSRPTISLNLSSAPVRTVTGKSTTALAPANFYALPAIRDSGIIPVTYTLTNATGAPVRFVRAFYSPDGGGRWFPASNANITQSNVVTGLSVNSRLSLAQITDSTYIPPQYSGTYVYNWDVFNSGFLGQSDNVVFRLEAFSGYTPTENSVANSYLLPSVAAQTYPFRVRGTQIQVLSGTTPVSGAMVYRLPAGKSVKGLALGGDVPFVTNENGYLQGGGQIDIGDRLLALAPVKLPVDYFQRYGNSMGLYYTNGTPTKVGVNTLISTTQTFTVSKLGVQQLVVSPNNPLILFDLIVTLEWDASQDPAYLSQLEFDLKRASQHLYDFTDGQVALGNISVNQNDDYRDTAHVVVHATNRLRPHATVGGVVLTETIKEIEPVKTVTYNTGQVHIGATWNRYGSPSQSIGVDWPVILAHELGHYLLFLEDTYLGLKEFDGANVLASVDSCVGSAMGDVYNINNTEFVSADGWLPDCASTLSHQELARAEWNTITDWYPWLNPPPETANPGPSRMPFELTTVTTYLPDFSADTLEDPTFYLDYAGGEVSTSKARAFLLRKQFSVDDFDAVYDLGSPVGGQNRVLARGAASGDRLCVFDPARAQFGCETITAGDERLTLKKNETWQPVIKISPVNSTTFVLTVEGVDAGLQLRARLYPNSRPAFTATLPFTDVNGRYTTLLILDEPALTGNIQLWVDDDDNENRREAIVSYSIGGNPGTNRSGGGTNRSGGGTNRSGGGTNRSGGGTNRSGGGTNRSGGGTNRSGGGTNRSGGGYVQGEGRAPAVSPDGQMTYFDQNFNLAEGQFYTVQDMAGLPQPLPLGKVAIGRGYNLMAVGFPTNTQTLTGSVSFQYRGNDVLVEERSENELGIHFWRDGQWRALNTDMDTTANLASARSRGPGVYALLAGVTTPEISAVSPKITTANSRQTLVITGQNFLEPVSIVLDGPLTQTLIPQSVSNNLVTAEIPPTLPAGEYTVWVNNRNHPSGPVKSPAPGVVALFEKADDACFYDFFESGTGQWTTDGTWGLVRLPSGTAITDSPGINYNSSASPTQLVTTAITSKVPFQLTATCANPVLTFKHDYVLAKSDKGRDTARVEISTDNGATWLELIRYTGGGIYDNENRQYNTVLPDNLGNTKEWADVMWKEETINLSAYTGHEKVWVRFSFTVDDTTADKGWIIAEMKISSSDENR